MSWFSSFAAAPSDSTEANANTTNDRYEAGLRFPCMELLLQPDCTIVVLYEQRNGPTAHQS
jgi:hypothetical protein